MKARRRSYSRARFAGRNRGRAAGNSRTLLESQTSKGNLVRLAQALFVLIPKPVEDQDIFGNEIPHLFRRERSRYVVGDTSRIRNVPDLLSAHRFHQQAARERGPDPKAPMEWRW